MFHTELARDGPGLLLRDILSGDDPQVMAVARVLTHVDADILVLAGIDYDHRGLALGALADLLPDYPHRFARLPNRGRATGRDLDGDGRLGGPGDAIGYGPFAGAEGLAILSRFPLLPEALTDRTDLPWPALKGGIAPEGARYLSTTAHWRVPVMVPGAGRVDLVTWHATPPVFDGPEDRNGRRNRDEALLALRMVEADPHPVIVAGFANLDVQDGDGRPDALQRLLTHPRLTDPRAASAGGREAAGIDGGVNASHRGNPALDTVDWPDEPGRPGNLRVDYLLPDRRFWVSGSGVLWPAGDGSLGSDVRRASRHRVVWVDLVPDGTPDGGEGIGHAKAGQ